MNNFFQKANSEDPAQADSIGAVRSGSELADKFAIFLKGKKYFKNVQLNTLSFISLDTNSIG